MPTWAIRRSANPNGAFTSPSRFRSVVSIAMVVSSQQFESSVDVRFHCSNRLSQRVRGLLVRKLLHVAQDDRVAKTSRKTCHPLSERIDLQLQQTAVLGTDGVIWFAPVQLHQARAQAPRAVPHHVQRDAMKPGLLLQLPNAVRWIRDKRAIGA